MRTNDVGNLKTSRVEVLRGRIHNHAVVSNRTKWHELIARHDEFTMDLIRDHLHTMLLADVVHPLQFLALPDSACGVVRVAEQEECDLLVSTLGLKVDEIDFKAIVEF